MPSPHHELTPPAGDRKVARSLTSFRAGATWALGLAGIVVTAAIGIVALGSALGLPPLPEPLAELDRRLPVVFNLHMTSAGLGLILLPWILLLRHRPSLHRVLGRLGAALLLVGAVTAVPSALQSEAVPVARLGFLAQGVLCLVFLVSGVRAIWRRDARRHAQLMMRVSALVLGAIVLRVLLAGAMNLGLPFDPTYAALAWLSWGVPLAGVMLWPMVRQPRSDQSHRLAFFLVRGRRERHSERVMILGEGSPRLSS